MQELKLHGVDVFTKIITCMAFTQFNQLSLATHYKSYSSSLNFTPFTIIIFGLSPLKTLGPNIFF